MHRLNTDNLLVKNFIELDRNFSKLYAARMGTEKAKIEA